VADLRQSLSLPGITVLCGPSGVGKSSLLNALLPELALRVGTVSGRLQRGRHTTRHVELFPLAEGALVADSPGFNRPHVPSDPAALAGLFPEVRQRLRHHSCLFRNCLHRGDPGCVVGTDWDRHPHYASCLAELLVQRSVVPDKDSATRFRGGRIEPRLDPQLRQSSRRRVRQGQGEDDDGSGSLNLPPDQAG
jgi:ribosome biogenesis GTPase